MLLSLGLLVAGVWVWSGWRRPLIYWNSWFVSVENGLAVAKWPTFDFVAPEPGSAGLSHFPSSKRGWSMWLPGPFHYRTEQPDAPYEEVHWNAGFVQWIGQNLQHGGPVFRELRLVLWPIPFLVGTPAALLLRSGILARRRANAEACPKCGYSLAGLAADAPCPECGKGAKVTA